MFPLNIQLQIPIKDSDWCNSKQAFLIPMIAEVVTTDGVGGLSFALSLTA